MNVEGTRTGRFSSKVEQRSNTPKPGDESDEPRVVYFMGGHLGPRTRQTHPYSYDPILVHATGEEPTGSLYSDRLMGWYGYDTVRAAMQRHFGDQRDDYSGRSVSSIDAFLRELLGQPELRVVRIEEHCNQATGYPVWFFAYRCPNAD